MADDYAVASFATMNPVTWEGTRECFMMEEISVRNGDGGHQCSNCYAPWVNKCINATDETLSGKAVHTIYM